MAKHYNIARVLATALPFIICYVVHIVGLVAVMIVSRRNKLAKIGTALIRQGFAFVICYMLFWFWGNCTRTMNKMNATQCTR
jgi:hypothetical protein